MSSSVPLIIHSINEYLQNSYYVPISELSASHLIVNKKNKVSDMEKNN